MNRGKKLKQMRRYILRHARITSEYKRPPDKDYPPYRKGSYFVFFISDELDIGGAVGDVDKYTTYKEVIKTLKECKEINERMREEGVT